MEDGIVILTGLLKYAAGMGIELEQKDSAKMVSTFRTKYKDVPELWYAVNDAFFYCANNRKRQRVNMLEFLAEGDGIKIVLPSGRPIYYMNPVGWLNEKGKELRFEGYRKGQWGKITTWGGRLVENIVQAISRDVLVEGMIAAEKAGLTVVGHAHDEIICEVDESYPDAPETLSKIMSRELPWAPSLPLAAEGWEGERYAKQ